jgi:transposase
MAKRSAQRHPASPAPALVIAAAEIAKDKVLVGVRGVDGRTIRKEFPNGASGHAAALRWWRQRAHGAPLRVCLEPTGTYSLDLALLLGAQPRLELSAPNPCAVRAFAAASMQRDKDDQIDLELLLEFCARMDPVPWQPPAPEALELRWITRRMSTIQKTLSVEKNRLHAASASHTAPAIVRQGIQQSIRTSTRELAALQRQALALIAAHPVLDERFRLLRTIPGFGLKSAVALLGELGVLSPDLTARQWVRHAALCPIRHRSGTSVNKPGRIGKAGNKHLRLVLFMPALVAIRYQPQLRAFRDRLVARGLKPIQAVVAVMRRLLHIVHAVLRTRQAFDPTRVGVRQFAPMTQTAAA